MIAVVGLLAGNAIAEPSFTREQASKLARVILDAPQHKKYREIFDPEKLTYDPKIKLWVFNRHFPLTGGVLHVFDLREEDGFYRLGTISTHTSSKSASKFGIAPNLKRPIRNLLKEFETKRKQDKG
jgi:hypothetical protein